MNVWCVVVGRGGKGMCGAEHSLSLVDLLVSMRSNQFWCNHEPSPPHKPAATRTCVPSAAIVQAEALPKVSQQYN